MEHARSTAWRIGLVGFSYPEWSGTLYRGVRRPGERLARYAESFNTVEINTTFYAPPAPATVRAWNAATPEGFRFSVKMSRDVTHGPTPPGGLASASGPPPGHLSSPATLDTARRLIELARPLGAKLGAVLLQFPRAFGPARRDELQELLHALAPAGVRLAVELRGRAWWSDEAAAATASMLRTLGVVWVATDDSARRSIEAAPAPGPDDPSCPPPIVPTADVLYVRLLGVYDQHPDRLREHFDTTRRLAWWHARIAAAAAGDPAVREVYVFFDNNFAGHAPHTARRMLDMPGVEMAGHAGPPPSLFG